MGLGSLPWGIPESTDRLAGPVLAGDGGRGVG